MNKRLWQLLAVLCAWAASCAGALATGVGTVTVYIEPPQAAVTGGYWKLDSGSAEPSGVTLANVSSGYHTISFGVPANYGGTYAPGSQSIYVLPYGTVVTSGTFEVTGPVAGYYQPGSLMVTLDAVSAAAGATWNVDGAAPQSSGATFPGLADGVHMLNFSPLAGYVTPASQPVTITGTSLLSVSGSYSLPGAVTVNLTPSDAAVSGSWNVDGGASNASGSTVTGLAPGNHLISFSQAVAEGAPTPMTVNVLAGGTTAVTGTYTAQSGQVTVALSPAAAVAAGAQWYVDAGPPEASGSASGALSPGPHTIYFMGTTGYDPPASQSVTVTAGQTVSASGTYTAQTGGIVINATGVTVSIGPGPWVTWFLDGTAMGTTLQAYGISEGSHVVSFGAVQGYNTPASQTITVLGDQVTTVSTVYTTAPVSFQIGLISSLTNGWLAGAEYNIDGGPWQTNGYPSASVGTHTINFLPVAGYVTPASQQITLYVTDDFDFPPVVEGVYTPLPGFVSVTISPAGAVSAGAEWELDGGTPQVSGALLSNVSAGTHTLSFTAAPGYIAPANQTITVNSNQTTITNGTYTVMGSLTVTLNPAGAASAGAQWNVDGGTWQNSGATVAALTTGTHALNFSAATGYLTPASQTVTIASGQNLQASVTYVQAASVSVTIIPAGAATSAYWILNTSAPQTSGGTLGGLAAGSYTIYYTEASGYNTPATQTVTVSAGQTLLVTGTYVPYPGSLTVNLTPAGSITAGALWYVDGGSPQASGSTIALPPGNHTLNFVSAFGYSSPAPQTVNIVTAQNTTLTGTYSALPLPVITSPTTAQGGLEKTFNYQIQATYEPSQFGAALVGSGGLPPGLSFSTSTGLISGTPSATGTFNLALSATNPSGSGTAGLTLVVVTTPIVAWNAGWFGSGASSSVTGDSVVSNASGIPNLLAYGLGLDPWTAGARGLPGMGMMTSSGNKYLTLTFTRNTVATDITYIVEANTTLSDAGWTPVATFNGVSWSPSTYVTETGNGTTVNVQVQDSQPVGTSATRLMRLLITH